MAVAAPFLAALLIGMIDLSGAYSQRLELEQADRALLLSERRAPDKQDVIEALEFNRAVDAEVGPRTARQFALELDVHVTAEDDRARALVDHDLGAPVRLHCNAFDARDKTHQLGALRIRHRDIDSGGVARVGQAGAGNPRTRP